MTKSFFKVFLSKTSEESWLNKMGQEGYLLTGINDSKYSFDLNEKNKYYYSTEYLDFSPKSEMADEYFKSREKQNIIPVLTHCNWVYFCGTNKKIEENEVVYKKNSSVYFWRSFYLLFFSAFGAILSGYQIFAAKYIPIAGHEGNGKFELLTLEENPTGSLAVLNVLKEWWNSILGILNDTYLNFLTGIFGENDTVFVQAWLIPAFIILLLLFAVNFEQYLHYCERIKRIKKINAELEAKTLKENSKKRVSNSNRKNLVSEKSGTEGQECKNNSIA